MLLGKKEFLNFFFSQKGMYKCYLLKYFGTFTIFIDHTMIDFQKHWLINRGNTTSITNCHLKICPDNDANHTGI